MIDDASLPDHAMEPEPEPGLPHPPNRALPVAARLGGAVPGDSWL
ncbi:MAG: hypothetical protein OXF88_07465 [Rhodobacteraceae bacterium]|nr:hypothetical protein [Paracoccaceae bacterium]MCY4138908.1 hypothetical protein [Paracoccaceae bacterium]